MTEPFAIAAVVAVTVATAVIGARGVRVARTPADFMVAARQVPPALNAAAISGEYLSAASFLGIAGLALLEGLGAMWYAVGYAAGYLVLLAAVAAPLRRFGAYTIPDFAEGRLGSPRLRRWSTAMVLVICAFYLLPQLNGAGITLQQAIGGPYWIGVVTLGAVVTLGIASGGMKGITVVQSFLYWLKLVAIALPALVLLVVLHHPPVADVEGPAPVRFARATTVRFPDTVRLVVRRPVTVVARAVLAGVHHVGRLVLGHGTVLVQAGSSLRFPAGALAPAVQPGTVLSSTAWSSPLVQFGGRADHPLAATYGVLLATVFGAMGLPHILVRFYTNRDGRAARRTTAFVLLMVSVFYGFPAIFAVLGRLEAPQLYVSGQTDAVVLALPRLAAAGVTGRLLGALVAAGAFAAFLSTSSGLLIAMAGALSHDILGRGVRSFRVAAVAMGTVVTCAGLAVAAFPINVLVGWAFAVAAASFCPLLLLGIWWRRLTATGALWGLLLGGGASSLAVVADLAGAGRGGGWTALLLGEPAIWAVPLAFGTMVVGSLATTASMPPDVDRLLATLHVPEQLRPGNRRRAGTAAGGDSGPATDAERPGPPATRVRARTRRTPAGTAAPEGIPP